MQMRLIPAALLVLTACAADRVTGVEPGSVAPQYEAPSAARGTVPLIYIDGKEATVAAVGALTGDAVLSVEVVKGKAAVSRYGARGVHGVIFIVTKAGASVVAR